MLKDQNIVVFANDFRSDPTSKHQVMKILSRNNKVLWINSIALRKPKVTSSDAGRILNKIRGFFRGLDRENQNLSVFTPLVLPLPSSLVARKLNTWLLRLYLKYYMRTLGMKDVQLWTFMPTMVDLTGKLKETKLIYYCVDEWSEFSFIDKESIIDMERRLIEKSDLVLTTADKLYEDKKKYNPNTHLIRHGVDFDFFSRSLEPETSEPDDIKNLPHPRIGFYGLIHEWIDLKLIEHLAKKHPDWSLVMIGKVSTETSFVKKYKNVHFLGQKPYDSLPGYCKGFDVGLIPFVINKLTLNVNPIKLREYLAAGLPTVSTNLPEITDYKEVVHIADDYEAFDQAVQKALEERSPGWIKKRQDAVQEETWEARVEQISQLVEAIERRG
jgi:glycosyltransferase involved in cell wall biosynthesis